MTVASHVCMRFPFIPCSLTILIILLTGDINAPPGLTASADVLKYLLRKLLQVCMF
jgi:hypothetical protein